MTKLFKAIAACADTKSDIELLSGVHCEGGRVYACDLDKCASMPNDGEYVESTSYDVNGNKRSIHKPLSDFGDASTTKPIDPTTLVNGFNCENIAAMLKPVLHSISTEKTRYYLQGVFFDTSNPHDPLTLVSTDGYRLTAFDTGISVDEHRGVIVPRDAVKILCTLNLTGDWRVEWSNSLVSFTEPKSGFNLTTKVIDGSYPDWRRVVPRNTEPYISAVARDIAREAKAFKAFSNLRRSPVKLEGLTFTAKSDGMDDKEVLMDGAQYADFPIVLNAGYLLDAARVIGKGDLVLSASDTSSPVLITSPTLPYIRQVVMSLRI